MKQKKRKIPPIRRYRRAALTELALIVALAVLAAVLISQKMNSEPVFEIREDRLMTPNVHIITTAPEPTPEPTPEAAAAWGRYPVPLEDGLQKYIIELCRDTAVSPCLVMAVIAKETHGTFDPMSVGDNGHSFGLMQIYEEYHRDRMERLGVFDLFDPYQNVAVGIDLLSELYGRSDSTEWVLMAYNGGPDYADEKTEKGIVTEYAEEVMRMSECYMESVQTVVE